MTMEDTGQEEAQIQEEVASAAVVEEPGEIKEGMTITAEAGDSPVQMTATELKSAGYAIIYDNKKFERRLTNMNMLPIQLRKKRPDKSRVFAVMMPGQKVPMPQRGAYKCMLHLDDPNRDQYDKLGLAQCRKSNLISPYMVRQHMKKRHPQEWEAIEQERMDAKEQKQADRDDAFLKGQQAMSLIAKQANKKK
jgi:hypothetical protein